MHPNFNQYKKEQLLIGTEILVIINKLIEIRLKLFNYFHYCAGESLRSIICPLHNFHSFCTLSISTTSDARTQTAD